MFCFSEFQHITECMYSNGYQCASPMANQVASRYTNYTSQITNFTPVLKIQLVHVYINISDCICQKHACYVTRLTFEFMPCQSAQLMGEHPLVGGLLNIHSSRFRRGCKNLMVRFWLKVGIACLQASLVKDNAGD